MLDELHMKLLSGVVSPFHQSEQNRTAEVYEDNAIDKFLEVLSYCKENKSSLTNDDLVSLGRYYQEIEEHIHPDDLIVVSMVLSADPDRSGRQEVDLREFVKEISLAREQWVKNVT